MHLASKIRIKSVSHQHSNSQEERQALLHEGSGSAAVNAFVEIVFDNSDHRFQHENSDEVVLRRTIGLKKDEFFLQRKRTTKSEIQSLLEGAGFSKSNPYFIVQQGKVQDLCTMSDAARLRLLKEVAGTTVYDEKKAESVTKMEENRNSIQKISEMLANIEERLHELNAEKDELAAYQQLDRERRAAQFALYSLELQKARAQLDQVEQDRSEHFETVETLHEATKVTHDSIRNTEAVLKTKASQLRRVRQTVSSLEDDKKQAVLTHTKLDLECQELDEALIAGDELVESNKKKLAKLELEISKAKAELDNVVAPNYDTAAEGLQDMVAQRDSATKQMEALYAKQGRGRMFRTAAERDEFLVKSSAELETAKAEKDSELTQQRDSLANLRRTVEQETSDVAKLKQELIQKSATQQSFTKSTEEKNRQRLEQNDARRDIWRQTEELQEQSREARETLHSCFSDTRKTMPRATSMGLEALHNIVEQEGLVRGKQYFGMLMENMTLKDPKFQAAVEIAAQNSLFHVIVDNDQTAARLLTRLEDGKLGRVTFLPLNQLRIDHVKYPEESNKDVRPLIDLCLTYDKSVERAIQHVFAKKLIARTQEVASEWSTKLHMDAITLDGDLCGRKGALTGGFVDSNKSRLQAYARQTEAQETMRVVDAKYRDAKASAQAVDQGIQTLMQELQRLEAKQVELNRIVVSKESDLDRLEQRLQNHTKQVEEIEKSSIPTLERIAADLDVDIKRLQEEIGSELQHTLTTEDRERLVQLRERQESLSTQIEAQQDVVDAAGIAKKKLLSLLDDNLLRSRRELSEDTAADDDDGHRRTSRGRQSTSAAQAQRRADLAMRTRERDDAVLTKDEIEDRLEETRTVESNLRKELHVAKNEIEQLSGQDMQNAKALEDAQDKSERFLNKVSNSCDESPFRRCTHFLFSSRQRALYTSKRESNMRKIQELGSLPPPAELKKFSGKSASSLEKALDNINNKLKKYSHVNKKAFDQYVNFNETRMRLLQRKEELDHSAEKVVELIENLDLKKDEAINRTFRGVSSHFKDVFKELVPNGAAELIMRTSLDNETANTDVEQESSEENSEDSHKSKIKYDKTNPDVSLYRGIGIKVRFSEVGENFIMSQLSGGQKALVALGLIFAIQRKF